MDHNGQEQSPHRHKSHCSIEMWGQLPPLRLFIHLQYLISHFLGLKKISIHKGIKVTSFWKKCNQNQNQAANLKKWRRWWWGHQHELDYLNTLIWSLGYILWEEKTPHGKGKSLKKQILPHTISYSFTVSLSASGRTSPWLTGASKFNINTPNNLPRDITPPRHIPIFPLQEVKSRWHSPCTLVLKDPLLTYLVVSVPYILTFRYIWWVFHPDAFTLNSMQLHLPRVLRIEISKGLRAFGLVVNKKTGSTGSFHW